MLNMSPKVFGAVLLAGTVSFASAGPALAHGHHRYYGTAPYTVSSTRSYDPAINATTVHTVIDSRAEHKDYTRRFWTVKEGSITRSYISGDEEEMDYRAGDILDRKYSYKYALQVPGPVASVPQPPVPVAAIPPAPEAPPVAVAPPAPAPPTEVAVVPAPPLPATPAVSSPPEETAIAGPDDAGYFTWPSTVIVVGSVRHLVVTIPVINPTNGETQYVNEIDPPLNTAEALSEATDLASGQVYNVEYGRTERTYGLAHLHKRVRIVFRTPFPQSPDDPPYIIDESPAQMNGKPVVLAWMASSVIKDSNGNPILDSDGHMQVNTMGVVTPVPAGSANRFMHRQGPSIDEVQQMAAQATTQVTIVDDNGVTQHVNYNPNAM
ncbi:MAG: hypothetical protein ACLQVD_18500 [Capsulimonadaceae bacterium]